MVVCFVIVVYVMRCVLYVPSDILYVWFVIKFMYV